MLASGPHRILVPRAVAATRGRQHVDGLVAAQRLVQRDEILRLRQARLRERSLDVEWTEVRAPVSGRISDRRVDTGNLVVGGEGTSATLLTTISGTALMFLVIGALPA